MRLKSLQDVANTLCRLAVAWRDDGDLHQLAVRGTGSIVFDVGGNLAALAQHQPIDLKVATNLSDWYSLRLKQLKVPVDRVRRAEVIAKFDTTRILTNTKRILSVDWLCASSIETARRTFQGVLEIHEWYERAPPNKSLERTRDP